MKNIFALLSLLVLATGTYSQSKSERGVADAVEQLRVAMINADKSNLENLTSDKLSYGHSGGHIDDKKEFIEKIVSGKSDFVTMELTEQAIMISGKTAIVRHKLAAATNDGGK